LSNLGRFLMCTKALEPNGTKWCSATLGLGKLSQV
jgi:hypothetical protein